MVDIVGTAILYVNVERFIATVSKPMNADFFSDFAISQCRMIFTQPGRKICITPVFQRTCGHHFCARGSLETIPAIESIVTLGV